MTRTRILLFLLTIIIVSAAAYIVGLYARGYRFNGKRLKIEPNGLLVIKSDPDGAQVLINGELETATNSTIPLSPGSYDVSVRKEGFIEWQKRLEIQKEVVTETTAHIFKSAPSLSAITFSGVSNPLPADDMSKIAYIVPSKEAHTEHNLEKAGLWVMETVNLPIGFSRDPRRITDGDLAGSSFEWSPDGRQILLSTKTGTYLLDAGRFTSQKERVNILFQKPDILEGWQEERKLKLEAKFKRLPNDLQDILKRKASNVAFSPDEDMILYTASGSATLADSLIPTVPGASTQKQERGIKEDHTYVYDIKEDRNFFITDQSLVSIFKLQREDVIGQSVFWFATSRHLVFSQPEKITIMDYDGTNRKEVYKGSYVNPLAFSTLTTSRLIILTNLGSSDSPANLYSLSVK